MIRIKPSCAEGFREYCLQDPFAKTYEEDGMTIYRVPDIIDMDDLMLTFGSEEHPKMHYFYFVETASGIVFTGIIDVCDCIPSSFYGFMIISTKHLNIDDFKPSRINLGAEEYAFRFIREAISYISDVEFLTTI